MNNYKTFFKEILCEAEGYCPKCGSRLYPADEEYIEKAGVCSDCVTWDKTPDQRYKKAFERGLKEHESGGPISTDVNDPLSVIPCESSEFPARKVFPKITPEDQKIRDNNLLIAKDLLTKVDGLKGQRGAKSALIKLGVTGSMIKAVFYGLKKFNDPEVATIKKDLMAALKDVFKRKLVDDCYSKDELLETLALKKYEDQLVVVSDMEDRKAASGETFRHKNALKKAGFRWDGKLNSWTTSGSRLKDAQTLIGKLNKRPVEVIINTLDDLPEFVLNQDNLSRKQELATKIESFVTDLSNEVDEVAASKKVQDFLEFNRRFRSYSITNTFLIYLQKHEATKVAGFHQWRTKFFRLVKKGATPITIFAPMTYKQKDDVDIDDGDLDKDVRSSTIRRFIPVTVFDVSDTYAMDERGNIPETPKWYGDETPDELADKLYNYSAQLAEELGIKITHDIARRGEKGFSAGDHINITSNVDGVGKAATMIHEIAHELMHKSESSLFYVETATTSEQKELQAESISYVVLRHYNLPVQHQSTYLALWKANKSAVQSNLELIKNVSNFIIDKLDKIAKETSSDTSAAVKQELNEALGGLRGLGLSALIGGAALVHSPQTFAGYNKPPAGHVAEPKGVRNNNPGNIRVSADNWQGQVGKDGNFLKFDTAQNGIRAMAKILKTYQNKYNLDTITKLISRWAPTSENPTSKYIDFVANQSKIDKNQKVNLKTDKDSLREIIKAMIKFENGGKPPYSDNDIAQAISKS
jgi:hypothetical protein